MAGVKETSITTSAERFGAGFGGERMWGLKELPYPDPVPFTPETAGWLVVGIVLLLLVAWLVRRAWRRWRAGAYRREALRSLERLSSAEGAQLPFVLRRTALMAADRTAVASLRGRAWIDWLNESADETLFEPLDAELLDRLAYGSQPIPEPDWRRLVDASRRWVQGHRQIQGRRRMAAGRA